MLPIAILARDLSVPRISKKNLPAQIWPIAALILVVPFLEPSAQAQAQQHPGMSDQTPVVTTPTGESSVIRLTVRGENKARLDRQAVIKLYSHIKNATTWQTTSDDSKADFIGLGIGQYDVQVSAVGYLTTEKHVQIVTSQQTVELDIVLQQDPSAVDLNTLSNDLPQKVRKEANRALVALKSGNLKDAQKHLDKAYAVAPSSAEINFLFGYLCFQRKDFEKAEPYLQRASALDSHNTPALILLGRVQLRRADFVGAQKALAQATAADPANWQAHELLAEVYLKQRDYEKARLEAQFALDKGKGERSAALLVLGQALANLGHDQEGIQALNTFLQTAPESSLAAQVRALVSELEKRDSGRGEHASTMPLPVSPVGDDLAFDDSQPSLPDRSWQPAGIDDAKPSVAADLTCPYDHVIDMSGDRIKQLVDDLNRFAAIEELLHERLDVSGNLANKETRKFDYIATISDAQPGFLEVNEYRGQRYGASDLPDDIATQGFAALALVFHPEMRDNFQMTCEGLGEWRGQATWLVHFRQRDDRPSRIQSFIIGQQEYPVKLKGRAWITADNFQIVRIEAELVSPIPQIRLRTEHQIVEYGPIPFPKKNLEIWLPKSAEIYLDFRQRRYYRRHSFDHYMLFATDSQDKPDLTKYLSHDGQSKPPKDAAPSEAH
jgi:tetratricopeptide (TPR) repeat protein